MLGVYLTCRLALPGMIERGGGRIVITGSGAAYLPASSSAAYSASKAAVCRFGEVLANQVEPHGVKVFVMAPASSAREMTRSTSRTTRPGRRPSCAPQLVLELACGRFDALAGRYLHAEHDPPDELERRIDRILAEDLNAIRLRRESWCSTSRRRSSRSRASGTRSDARGHPGDRRGRGCGLRPGVALACGRVGVVARRRRR